MKEQAVLVTVRFDTVKRGSTLEEAARELEELVVSAGIFVSQRVAIKQKNPTASLLLGKGRAEQLAKTAADERADVVVFESDLSSTQQRNLEEILQTKTIDRTQLILDIFALRARSMEGKLQVELAQLKYLLPRLSGKGIYLSRLGGGIGTRGPGEQKLEVDRRRIRERISRLSNSLGALQKKRHASIAKKKDKEFPLVALVGYTNAGKSSLFNALTGASAVVKDKLFSTLDTTTRLLNLPGNQRALVADTVGFIRDLPHHLIESFKATLEEVVSADILLHVVDASRSDIPLLEAAVHKVFEDLEIGKKKIIPVLNKMDLLKEDGHSQIRQLKRFEGACFVSAKTGEGLANLTEKLARYLALSRREVEFFLPKTRLGLANFLYREGEVLDRRDMATGSTFKVSLSSQAEGMFRNKLKERDLNNLDNI